MAWRELVGLLAAVILLGRYGWPVLIVWVAYAVWRRGLTWRELLGNRRLADIDWKLLWIIPFCAMFTFGAIWLVLLPLAHWQPALVERWLNSPFDATDILQRGSIGFALLMIVVVVPLIEELAFRGLVLRKLAESGNRRNAMLWSAALFAVLHAELLGHFVIGIVFCLLYFRGGLLLAVAGHMLNNLLAMASVVMEGKSLTAKEYYSLAEFQSDAWMAAVALLISVPAVLYFIVRHGSAVNRMADN